MDAERLRVARRRPRHTVGFSVFAIGAAAVLAIAFAAAGAFDRDAKRAAPARSTASTSAVTTEAERPPAGPYKVTDGVNVRSGPSTSHSIVGTVELGKEVLVACAIDGQLITGPSGSTTKWLLITSPLRGYVTQVYVTTGPAINDRSVIPLCAGA